MLPSIGHTHISGSGFRNWLHNLRQDSGQLCRLELAPVQIEMRLQMRARIIFWDLRPALVQDESKALASPLGGMKLLLISQQKNEVYVEIFLASTKLVAQHVRRSWVRNPGWLAG